MVIVSTSVASDTIDTAIVVRIAERGIRSTRHPPRNEIETGQPIDGDRPDRQHDTRQART